MDGADAATGRQWRTRAQWQRRDWQYRPCCGGQAGQAQGAGTMPDSACQKALDAAPRQARAQPRGSRMEGEEDEASSKEKAGEQELPRWPGEVHSVSLGAVHKGELAKICRSCYRVGHNHVHPATAEGGSRCGFQGGLPSAKCSVPGEVWRWRWRSWLPLTRAASARPCIGAPLWPAKSGGMA